MGGVLICPGLGASMIEWLSGTMDCKAPLFIMVGLDCAELPCPSSWLGILELCSREAAFLLRISLTSYPSFRRFLLRKCRVSFGFCSPLSAGDLEEAQVAFPLLRGSILWRVTPVLMSGPLLVRLAILPDTLPQSARLAMLRRLDGERWG